MCAIKNDKTLCATGKGEDARPFIQQCIKIRHTDYKLWFLVRNFNHISHIRQNYLSWENTFWYPPKLRLLETSLNAAIWEKQTDV